MIPDVAVDVVAKWLHDHDCRSALHSGFEPDIECYDWLDEAKEILEAAAPHMLATAWDAGHERGFWNGRLSQLTVPYDAPAPDIGVADAQTANPYR